MDSHRRNDSGFTLIEIITVLILLSIIAATVLGRSINTENTDLAAQIERVKNHFRFAQSMAMKYGDKVWGFRCADVAGSRSYWIFRLDIPVADTVNDPDVPANQVRLPGESELTVNLAQKKIIMDTFTVFLDRYGRPYTSYTDETTNTPLPDPYPPITISVLDGNPSGALQIMPETGMIR